MTSALFLLSYAHGYENKKHSQPHIIKKVLLVVAMQSEATPIINEFNLKKVTHPFSNLPMQGYRGTYKDLSIFLITNGQDPIHKVENVGTQAATLSTYLGSAYFHPDLIISIGVAGGMENNVDEKDIVISRSIYFYDRRIPSADYHEYGLSGYPSFNVDPITKKLNLKLGNVCSGDSFDENPTDYDQFLKLNCYTIDMEAAGVALVSMLTNTPMLAMKGITNYVRGNNIHQQYRKNLSSVTEDLTMKLKELLTQINNLHQ